MSETNHPLRDLAPPGELLAEALEERAMTSAELARRADLSEKHVSQLVNGHVPLSLDVALQLERVLGIPARLWNQLEFQYRSEQKRAELRAAAAEHADWMRGFPIAAMRKAGYFDGREVGRGVADRVEALLDFFGVASPDAWVREWAHATGRFRASPAFRPDHCALTAWLRRGELEAQAIRGRPFDARRFRAALEDARALTTETPDVFLHDLVRCFADAGVALTLVPTLPKLAVSGVTRWKGPDRAIVSLSLRHRSDDQLWFSLFHEACHVLEHRTGTIYVDSPADSDDDPAERRANAFARDLLIPPDAWARLVDDGRPSLAAVRDFADAIGVSPGIVVGRLQHDGVYRHEEGNRLKRFYRWGFES